MEAAAGTQITRDLYRLYARFHSLGLPRDFPRPETILEALYQIGGTDFLECLRFMDEVRPNSNHFALALMASVGANIFTTNFDTLIEQAAVVLSVPVVRARVHHLHGQVADIESLKATLSGITRPLDKDLRERLTAEISNAQLVVVAGYSASDHFDITPVLRSAFAEARGDLYWLQHFDGGGPERCPPHIEELVQYWAGAKRIILCDTGVVFDEFTTSSGKVSSKNSPQTTRIDWRKGLHTAIEDSLSQNGMRGLAPVAFADLIGCGRLALAYAEGIDISELRGPRLQLLYRRYLRGGHRLAGKYLVAVRKSLRSAVVTFFCLNRLRWSDFIEELYAINYEVRLFGQHDVFIYAVSLLPLIAASILLRLHLILSHRTLGNREELRRLRFKDGAAWALMIWLFCEKARMKLSGKGQSERGVASSALRAATWFSDKLGRRVVSWEDWSADDRNTLLLTLPDYEAELTQLTDETEHLLAGVNRLRKQRTMELAQMERGRSRVKDWRQNVVALAEASQELGDIPGEFKANVLLYRDALLIGEDEEAAHSKKKALELLEKIEWSRGACRYWKRLIEERGSELPVKLS